MNNNNNNNNDNNNKRMDQRTRKLTTMHKALYPRDDVDRLYLNLTLRTNGICITQHLSKRMTHINQTL